MYLFLDFIIAIMSLYYLSDIASEYGSDTSTAIPISAALLYSILNIAKRLKEWNDELLGSSDYYNNKERHSSYNTYRQVDYYYPQKPKTYEKKVLHYPSVSEVKNKIAKLEKKKSFRIKRKICSFFGYDITAKYHKPYYKKEVIVVADDSAYQPKYVNKNEIEEYNDVINSLSRSCEITVNL